MEMWWYGLIGAGSVVGVAAAVVFLFYFALAVWTCLLRRHTVMCNLDREASPVALQSRGKVSLLTFNELKKYSEGFSNRVGNGTTNYVYKGILPNGTEIAIKRTKDEVAHSSDVEGSFWFQVQLLSRIYHHHLINLVGICNEKNNQMLVFQYASNGTLFENLHGEEVLSWNQRMRVAVGVASGLAYLHHSCDPPVIHGDLKSCHVFLTEDYAAKIGGLGKVPIAASSELAVVRKMGGSVDPETVRKGVHSRAGDVYSFGVLLLELLSGKLAYCPESGMLVDWAAQVREAMGPGGLVDRRIMGAHMDGEDQVGVVCEVAYTCVQRDASRRPSMRRVVEMLQEGGLCVGPDSSAPCNSPVTLRGLLELS